MNNDTGIYAITSPSGKQYIGSAISFKRRWRRHLSDLRRGIHHSPSLQRAWDKYGEVCIVFQKVALCPVTDLIAVEQLCIDKFRPEYNIAKIAGASMAGFRHSLDTRLKMSLSKIGRTYSIEQRTNMSLAQKGKVFSEASRRKMSISQRLKRDTEETKANKSGASTKKWLNPKYRAKIIPSRQGERNSNFGKKATDKNKAASIAANSKPVVCIETGVTFQSAADAARWLKQCGIEKAQASPITQLCKGRGNIAYGYTWRYADQT